MTDHPGRRRRAGLLDRHGWVAERLKAPVLKTGKPKGFVGSNPTPSASIIAITGRFRPFVLN